MAGHDKTRARRAARIVIPIAAALLLLAGARAAAPWALERYANAKLESMDRYRGKIDGVELDITQGVGFARGFTLDKRGGAEQVFITADTIEVDLKWSELLREGLVLDLRVDGSEVNLVLDPDENKRELGAELRWNEFLMNLPFAVRDFAAHNGTVLVHGVGKARGTLEFRDIALELTSLDRPETRGRLSLEARAWDAPLSASGTFEPSIEHPAFDIEAHLSPLSLRHVNPWLRSIADLDLEQGTVAADLAAKLRRERLGGIVEARIAGAEFTEEDDPEGGPFKKMLEAIADFGVELFQNQQGNWTQRMTLGADVDMPSDPDLRGTLTAIKDAFRKAIRNGELERREDVSVAE